MRTREEIERAKRILLRSLETATPENVTSVCACLGLLDWLLGSSAAHLPGFLFGDFLDMAESEQRADDAEERAQKN